MLIKNKYRSKIQETKRKCEKLEQKLEDRISQELEKQSADIVDVMSVKLKRNLGLKILVDLLKSQHTRENLITPYA